MRIAFLGLGRMGSAIARTLMRAGHELTLYNRSREKAEAIGAPVAATPAEACHRCDVAITMLADDAAVRCIVYGPDGISDAAPVHIGCSTISTSFARHLADSHPGRYISAPVFGRPAAADAQKLLVVPAGPKDLVEHFMPLFDSMGRQTFVAGEQPWQANAVKLCGNFMLASMLETFGEAYNTLRKANVSPHLFLDVMNALFGSPVYSNYGEIIADEAFDPAGFALRLGLKDVRLVLETAFECGNPMPIASVLRDRFLEAHAAGQSDRDWSAVARKR